jgi:pimeloyl-ACP methyl ester carboxylesterase
VLRLAMRWPPVAASMRRRAEKDPARATRRSIPNPRVRARTLADPEAGPLLRALERSTLDRMDLRMPGTENDVATTRGDLAIPLESIQAPLLVVHGTEDELAPFSGGMEMATRVPRAEILAVEGGRHVTIYTHRERVRAEVARFLAEHAPPRASA